MGSGPKKHRQRRHINVRQHTAGSGGAGGNVRIIGGQWRGRKLPVADVPGLRPSGDRVRETLFNWLQHHISGARCLDLFAGTGVLGFEAASRGATDVILVDRSRQAVDVLRQSAQMLEASQVSVVEGDALTWLDHQQPDQFDIVFIDPPFDTDLATRALKILLESDCLSAGAQVYLETPRLSPSALTAGWLTERESVMGDVRIQLLNRPINA